MKIMHIVTVPERQLEQVQCVICDFCREKIPDTHCYDVNEVTIKHREGFNYPGGGAGKQSQYDCCPKCWTEKVAPALTALGRAPSVEEWDW